MGESYIRFIEDIKYLIEGRKTEEALELFLKYIKEHKINLEDELILIKGRYIDLLRNVIKNTITNEEENVERSRINDCILYMLKQVEHPESYQGSTQSSKRKSGKILHDIPSTMPKDIVTKCTVRIAEDEKTLLQNLELTEDTEIEDIPISEVMEVELIDFSESGAFEIRSFNTLEQTLEEGDFTQWLFFVKPLTEGVHTLYLKVSVIQYIHDKERKKEVVLERSVDVVTDIKPLLENDPEKPWQDTHIYIGEGEQKRAVAPLASNTKSAGKATSGPNQQVLKKRSGFRKFAVTGSLSVAAMAVIALGAIFLMRDDIVQQSAPVEVEYQSEVIVDHEVKMGNGDVVMDIPTEYDHVEYKDTIMAPENPEVAANVVIEPPKPAANPVIIADRVIENGELPQPVAKPVITFDPNAIEIIEADAIVVGSDFTPTHCSLKEKLFKENLLNQQKTVPIGKRTFIQLTLEELNPDYLKYFINGVAVDAPRYRNGSFYFNLRSKKESFTLKILDMRSKEHIERNMLGYMNYEWVIVCKRKN